MASSDDALRCGLLLAADGGRRDSTRLLASRKCFGSGRDFFSCLKDVGFGASPNPSRNSQSIVGGPAVLPPLRARPVRTPAAGIWPNMSRSQKGVFGLQYKRWPSGFGMAACMVGDGAGGEEVA